MIEIPLPDDLKKFLEKEFKPILDAYLEAEQTIKEVELTHGDLVIPAVNELRYAGRHLLTSFSLVYNNDFSEKLHDELLKAKSHCHRARYDAYQAACLFYIESINVFHRDYKYVPISDVIKDYTSWMVKLNSAQKFIGINNHGSLDIAFQELAEHYKVLCGFNELLGPAREELNKKLADQRKQTLRWFIGIGLTIIAILLGNFFKK